MQTSSWCHVIIFHLLSPLLYPPKYVSSESFLGYSTNSIQRKKIVKSKKTKCCFCLVGGFGLGFFLYDYHNTCSFDRKSIKRYDIIA